MTRFDGPEQVEAYARRHGVQRLRDLAAGDGLDPVSRHFVHAWLRRLDSELRLIAEPTLAHAVATPNKRARRANGWS